jgi:5-methylcytosine-specific restriction endonuclease McrA
LSLIVLLAFAVFLIYPPVIFFYVICGIGFWIWVSSQDRKSIKFQKEKYDRQWNPEAVFERRLQYAMNFEGRTWEARTVLEVGAVKILSNTYAGVIKTSTGREVWRCQHGHSKQTTNTRTRYAIDPSIKAARQCAQKELDKNSPHHISVAKKTKSGIRHKRSKMENEFFEPVYDTLKSFGYQCAYCGIAGLTKETTHRDHVVPLHVGGGNRSSNMLPICSKCNLAKGTMSVFQYLLQLEGTHHALPYWILNSPTWQDFRYPTN